MTPLLGRAAVVTGGGTGIGRAIVERLREDGARVLVAARSSGEVPAGEDATFVGNLADPAVAEALVAEAVDALGAVDVLVNNAGGGVIRPTLEHTEETLRSTIDNNLWTTLRCTLAVLPHMVARGSGRIVNIGAESVRNGLTAHAVYNAAKGGVHAFTTGLAREFASVGITVNTVAPSYTVTPELAGALREDRLPADMAAVLRDAVDLIPRGRGASPDEVAAAVAFLARDDARFVTGQVISVNGGSSMG